jgi:cellulose synthase operon protein C
MICTRKLRRLQAGALVCALLLASPGAAAPAGDLMVRARTALARGDGIAAEADLRRLSAQGSTRESLAAPMGEALIQQGDRPKAREWLAGGVFAKGDELYGYRMLGLLERLDGNLGAAGQAYDKALKIAPRDAQLWVDIGRLRYAGGEQIQAIDAAEHAVELGPDNVRALEFRAQLVRDQFGLDAALPWFEAALAKSPDDPELLAQYAATLGDLGRAKDMLAVTRKLVEVAPGHPMGILLQAALAARAGNIGLARAILTRAKNRLRGIPAANLLQGALELDAGNASFALELLEGLARNQPGNQRAQLLVVRALYDSGDLKGLVDRFGGMAARPDAPAYLLSLLGRAYEELGDRLNAAPLLDRASAATIPPVNANPFAHDTARPGSAMALAVAGDRELAAGRPAQAFERYALSTRIRFPESVMLRMTESNLALGRADMNPPLVSGYLASHPASRLAARIAAGYAAQGGDWQRCAALLDHLRQTGGARDVRLLSDLAIAQLRSGNRPAALETARDAYALQRGSALTTQALAMALIANRKELVFAGDLLDKARRIGGDNPLLTDARKQLTAARK